MSPTRLLYPSRLRQDFLPSSRQKGQVLVRLKRLKYPLINPAGSVYKAGCGSSNVTVPLSLSAFLYNSRDSETRSPGLEAIWVEYRWINYQIKCLLSLRLLFIQRISNNFFFPPNHSNNPCAWGSCNFLRLQRKTSDDTNWSHPPISKLLHDDKTWGNLPHDKVDAERNNLFLEFSCSFILTWAFHA